MFRRRLGPCPALRWETAPGRYVCGLVTLPGEYLRWLPAALFGVAGRLAARSIAAGCGCDCDAEVMPQLEEDCGQSGTLPHIPLQ